MKVAALLLAGITLLAQNNQQPPVRNQPNAPPEAGPAKEGPQQMQGPPGNGQTLPAPVNLGPRMTLDELEQMALRRNPALQQASAGVRSAKAQRQQAGLYPNPLVGYDGNEITPGRIIRGGEHGFFVQQRLITAGKLGISRTLADQDITLAQVSAAAQRQRVLNQVRSLYYQALGEQRLLAVRTELARLARRAVDTTSELYNVGQADRPDQLAVEIEAQRLELGLVQSRNALDRTWRQLAAATGNPDLQPGTLVGSLEDLPKLEFDQSLRTLLEQSPELKVAEVGVTRNNLAIRQARAETVPDLVVRGGLHYSRELLEFNQQPVGWQGGMEVAVSLPIFNRNQGAINAARAEAERSTYAVERARLDLRARLASVYREYRDSVAAAERYRTQMIPKAQQAYELYLNGFRQMAAAYPQVLITQRNLFQLQEDYVATLVSAWQRTVEIQGLLITADLELPAGGPRGQQQAGDERLMMPH